MNEREPNCDEGDNGQLEKASLWKKKISIAEPTSVHHNDDGETAVLEEKDFSACRKETNVRINERSLSRETFKQRAQQRQREIDQLKIILRTHQPENPSNHSNEIRGVSEEVVCTTKTNQEPFDFERMEKQHEIDSRFHQFCRTHNKLSKKPTGLLRAHMVQIEENSKRRFQPSCRSRRLQSESGSLSLVSKKNPRQLERMLVSLDEQCKQVVNLKSDTNAPPLDVSVDILNIGEQTLPKSLSSYQITNYPHQIDFEEEPFDYKKPFKILRTANSTIQFSQWKSVFSKNNK